MSIGIVSYGAGNVRSVQFALERMGFESFTSDDPARLAAADRLILPGVGAAAPAIARLRGAGLASMLVVYQKPVLGICLGMQLLCRHSEEGDVGCLGLFPANVRRFQGAAKVPHTGWNRLRSLQGPLFSNVCDGDFVYFVHSYFAAAGTGMIAESNYIHPFAAAFQKDNFFGVQFHPEKSGAVGEQVLKNFLSL